MFIPAALRRGIGTDYVVYVTIFDMLKNNIHTSSELGYKLLNQMLIFLDLDVQWVFTIMSFLTLFFLFLAVPRKSFYIIIPFYYMLLYTSSYNIVRQSLVVTIVYYAYQLFNKKKIVASFFYLTTAVLFHNSAILYCILFLMMLILKIEKNNAIFFLLILVPISRYADKIITIIFEYIISWTVYSHYISNTLFNLATENLWYGTISRYMIFFIVLISLPNIKEKYFSNMYVAFLSFVFAYLLGQSINIFGRLSTGFSFAWFPVIHVINIYHTRYRRIVLLLLYSWGLFYFIFSLKNNFGEVVPYKSIFAHL
jgi:hypothetical protein